MSSTGGVLQALEEEEIQAKIRTIALSSEKQASQRESIWKALNSAFVIWVLSSIVLGMITWSYSSWQEDIRTTKELERTIQKLDTEISYRFDLSSQTLPTYPDDAFIEILCYPPSHSSAGAGIFPNLRGDFSDSKWETDRYVFPEYKDRSIFSLMWELEQIVPEEQRSDIQGARAILQDMRDVAKNNLEAEKTTSDYLNSEEFKRWRL